jgi:hypothetical protein
VPVKMGCKPVVHFPVEEMTQEPCEGCCENSLKQLRVPGVPAERFLANQVH